MGSQRTGDVVKACLPQCGIVEQSLDKNHPGAVLDLFPRIQTALAAGKKSMGEGGADAAAVEVDHVAALSEREDDALIEGVGTVRVEQAGLPQQIKGVALCHEIAAQPPAGCIADLEFLDQGRIFESALVEIPPRFGIEIELPLIESGGLRN